MADNKTVDTEVADDICKPCFIITPIGAQDSDTFKKTKGLITSIINPVLLEFNFKAVPAYDIANSGSINRQILKSILNDELVIANLTGLNPNVMYELAVRHAIRKPIIIMAEHETTLPFDITDQRTIFYHNTLLGSEEAKPKLRQAIEAVLSDKTIDNPIYQVIEETNIIQDAKGPDKTLMEYLVNRFDQLEGRMNRPFERINSASQISNTEKLKEIFIDIEFKSKKSPEEQSDALFSILGKHKARCHWSIGSRTIRINFELSTAFDLFNTVLSELSDSKELKVQYWKYLDL